MLKKDKSERRTIKKPLSEKKPASEIKEKKPLTERRSIPALGSQRRIFRKSLPKVKP